MSLLEFGEENLFGESQDRLMVATTGGTIDSEWDPAVDTAVPTRRSLVPEYLNAMGVPYSIEHADITMVDSRRFGSAERSMLLSAIEETTARKILVSHGTFTMADSAAFIEYRGRKHAFDKTVVFTGSYWPMKGFSNSDGAFALGFAIAKIAKLPVGVFVCMSGQTFKPAEVTKILADPRFESIASAGSNPYAGGRALILMMGGTIDERYDARYETVLPRKRSAIPGYLQMSRLNWGVHCSALTLKDSRHLDDDDRERLAARIEASDEKFIIVTHGLFRMAETAEFLQERLATLEKEIVLTGSAVPLGIEMSDAGFNLGYAFGRARSLGAGTHICLNGRTMESSELREYLTAAKFAMRAIPPRA